MTRSETRRSSPQSNIRAPHDGTETGTEQIAPSTHRVIIRKWLVDLLDGYGVSSSVTTPVTWCDIGSGGRWKW